MANNFWGFLLTGAQSVIDSILNAMPHHQDIGLDALVVDLAGATPILLFLIVNQFISLTVPMLVWTSIIVLEVVRAALAAWQWVRNALPALLGGG